jgi:hypothetical protein
MSIPAEKVFCMIPFPKKRLTIPEHKIIAAFNSLSNPDAETRWHDTINRRSTEIAEGKVQCRAVEDAVSEIRKKLNARRQPS